MSRLRFTLGACAAVLAVIPSALAADGAATRSGNPDYAAFDDDNMGRSNGKQAAQLTSTGYGAAFVATATESHLENQVDQVTEADQLRLHATLGQLLPGGSVGNPERYSDVSMQEVNFVFRDGAKLEGHIFHSASPVPGPAVVITTGSIQGTQHMYWWAARTLAQNGYTVLTWDVQGQGESETTGHDPATGLPTADGVPFQQGFNFTEGTIDALKWFVSTPLEPYVPTGWSDADVRAYERTSDAAERIDWFNPAHAEFDGEHLGLAGHSLGAGSVSVVQQCSDHAELWQTLDICGGTAFPIDAVVGWDRLSADGVLPVVPAMDQQADGYFFNASPSETAPDPAGHLTAFDGWRAAGLDTMTLTVRGGTHIEWTEIPYILPSTTYGVFLADYYTLAWMERYVQADPARRAAALEALANGPVVADPSVPGLPWKAQYLSGRFASARAIAGAPETRDLRSWAGAAPVQAWSRLNSEARTARFDWSRDALTPGGYVTSNAETGA